MYPKSLIFVVILGGMLSTYVPILKKSSIFSIEVPVLYLLNILKINQCNNTVHVCS